MANKYEYQPIDRYITLNDGDQDLFPIKIDQLDLLRRTFRQYGAQEPVDFPEFELVFGYGKAPKDQYFEREEIPEGIIRIETRIRNDLKKVRNSSPIKRELGAIDGFWEEIEKSPEKYKKEIEWLSLMWYYRLFGKFVFINGKMTYIPPNYWWWANWWYLDGILPEYRSADRELSLGFLFAELDTTTFSRVNRDTREPIPNAEGEYEMIDLGERVCLGVNDPKSRRVGDTSRAQSFGAEKATRTIDFHFGTQGRDEPHAKKIFRENFMKPFEKLPIFFKPLWDSALGAKPKETILFDGEVSGFGLKTRVTHAQSANAENYNGDKLHYYNRDESGNCLKINEPILMHDGRFKKVQDIVVGDKLMGIDSTPRNVLALGGGRAMMYDVIPNSGNTWGCNGSHILSLKASEEIAGHKTGDVINISVDDYLKKNNKFKKGTVLYRKGIELPENNHVIEPYYLGLWLGDGFSSEPSITTPDKEIEEYIYSYAKKLKLRVSVTQNFAPKLNRLSKENAYRICGITNGKHTNTVLTELQKLNLIGNKHIPDSYLYDSSENRLKLLAGLLDSDGNCWKSDNRYGYEISQVNEDIANQIVYLVRSLGFKCSIVKKKTRSTGICNYLKDGITNRISIYGKDLYRIPCRVVRKKITKQTYSIGTRGRNPLHSGFKIVPTGVDDYYGFVIDGDHLFMLSDFTVTHNTKGEDVNKGHQIIKICATLGHRIVGFCVYTTTVEEVSEKSAGENYMKLCFDSHYHIRDENGRTTSGMYNFFVAAFRRMEGFIDPYGDPIIETPTVDQARFIGKRYGAKQFIESTIKELKRKKDWEGLAVFQRQYPCVFRDCFSPPAKNQYWDVTSLRERIQYLTFSGRSELPTRGNFRRNGGVHGWVEFVEDSVGGRFLLSRDFKPDETNLKYQHHGVYYSSNPYRFVASADTFGMDKTRGRASLGGGMVWWKFDNKIDDPKSDSSTWKTDRPIITYCSRPDTVEEYCDDMLMMCQYTGAMMYAERNKDNVNVWFKKMGYDGFLLYNVNKDGSRAQEAGFWSDKWIKIKIFNEVKTAVTKLYSRCTHVDWMTELIDIRDPEDMTNYDLFTAGGGCLLALNHPFYELEHIATRKINTSGIIPMRKY